MATSDSQSSAEHPMNITLLQDWHTFPGGEWDNTARMVLDLLLDAGLCRTARLIDVGAGSLRVGRYLVLYLQEHGYTGLEPEASMGSAGFMFTIGETVRSILQPRMIYESIETYDRKEDPRTYDWALGWDVFVHLPAEALEMALTKIRCFWLINVHIGESKEFPSRMDGWSYRHSRTLGKFYSQEEFDGILERCGYTPTHISCDEDYRAGWNENPLKVFRLNPL